MIFTVLPAVLAVIFLGTNKRYRWFYILHRTLGRDLRAAVRFAVVNFYLWWYQRTKTTLPKLFTQIATKNPHKVAFYFENKKWTFRDLELYSNKVAHFFKKEGFQRGDTVALFLENCPEYVGIWLGLGKIGVVTALVNTNLVADPLLHSIKVADAKAVIYGSTLKKGISDISNKLEGKRLYEVIEPNTQTGVLDSATDMVAELEHQSDSCLVEELAKGLPSERLIFIYTSGTTGLPKAAVITNIRYIFMALGMYCMAGLSGNDLIYDPLPLYHSAGGIVAAGQTVIRGVPVVIRRKFSASSFWKDCNKYKCSVAQYIGEICRYILLAHSNEETVWKHSVKKIIGNGLRPQIWRQFVTKFNIKEVYEFYGSTEGNSNLINIDSTVGAVGFIPRYATFLYPVTLIKCNEATGEPIRGEDGFCQSCQPGEPGILLGNVNQKKTISEFSGYADKKATQKKLIENVFKKGDKYFNSGDVLVQDEFGYFFFKDRTGDTFRWKGENVATSEIEGVISNVVNLSDAAVYGVEVPGAEGRAGMAAIVDTNSNLDMPKLAKGLKDNLPAYAIPVFVRVMTSVPMTGTFKLKKTDLQQEAFDVNKIKDKLFLYDAKNVTYVDLTKDKFDDIMSGKLRL